MMLYDDLLGLASVKVVRSKKTSYPPKNDGVCSMVI